MGQETWGLFSSSFIDLCDLDPVALISALVRYLQNRGDNSPYTVILSKKPMFIRHSDIMRLNTHMGCIAGWRAMPLTKLKAESSNTTVQ